MKKPTKSAALLSLCLCATGILLLGSSPNVRAEQAFVQHSPAAETFDGGYKTVEGMQSFLDARWRRIPRWPKRLTSAIRGARPTPAIAPSQPLRRLRHAGASYHQPQRARPQAGLLVRCRHTRRRDRAAGAGAPLHQPGCLTVTIRTPTHTGWWTTTTSGSCRWQTPTAITSRRRAATSHSCSARTPTTPTAATLIDPNGRLHFGIDLNRNFPFKWGTGDRCVKRPLLAALPRPLRGFRAGDPGDQAVLKKLIPDQRGRGR